MNNKSRVAIIFPYFRTRSATEMLFPPLGAANLASQLHTLGVETKIFDCTFLTYKQLRQSLTDYQPGIVGIYSMVTLSRNTFKIAAMIRANFPVSLLVAGGPLPTLYPEHYSKHFDAIFRGESDLSFPRFCWDVIQLGVTRENLGALPLNSYDGLFIDHDGLKLKNPITHYKESEINSFPLPDRSDFNHSLYQNTWFEKTGTKTTSIITTLGCPFSCDFCSKPIFSNVLRFRNLDSVFEEIEQIRLLGYDSLWIADDNFTLSPHYLKEFCRRMAGMGITWNCLSRVTGIDEETARQMKEGGCYRVYLGLEAGSQVTLELMNKKATIEDGINTVHQFKKAGVEVAAFFIVGYPGETIESIEETFKFALELPLDSISFNVPYPLPGSKLFERVSDLCETRDWNIENEVSFLYKSEFDQRWLKRRIKQTMKAFTEKKRQSSGSLK
jgi:anaerobic magnesium-protoporphyrin IX monomethyl ester cyclase